MTDTYRVDVGGYQPDFIGKGKTGSDCEVYPYGQAFFLRRSILFRRVTRMTGEKTTRELVYETNRDVKWICRARRAAGPELEHR